jgi:hypothetical protein
MADFVLFKNPKTVRAISIDFFRDIHWKITDLQLGLFEINARLVRRENKATNYSNPKKLKKNSCVFFKSDREQ